MKNAGSTTGNASALDRKSMRQWVADTILGHDFRAATFGGPVRGATPCPWLRVAVRPVELRGKRHLQFSYFDAKKHVTKNASGRDITFLVDEILDVDFAAVHLSTSAEEIDIRTTKKGKIIVGRGKAQPTESIQPHNRIKDVPLPEGQMDWLLEALGIQTRDGHVRPAKRAKFTQINEFLKQLTHVLDEAELRSLGREVLILDCGCGSSFLTLAVHHYLNDKLDIPARIMGVDVDEQLIRKSVERSERLGTERLEFQCGPIGAVETAPDIVLALHACDTATDDAIGRAIAARAKIVLSVPCCHHHLNDQLRAEVLRPLLRHGILHQRTADLITDAFRALALRIMGYRTEVVEFISTEHTARNLMIRAVFGVPIGEASFVAEYLEMRRFWGVTPYIEGVLGEPFQHLLAANPQTVAR